MPVIDLTAQQLLALLAVNLGSDATPEEGGKGHTSLRSSFSTPRRGTIVVQSERPPLNIHA